MLTLPMCAHPSPLGIFLRTQMPEARQTTNGTDHDPAPVPTEASRSYLGALRPPRQPVASMRHCSDIPSLDTRTWCARSHARARCTGRAHLATAEHNACLSDPDAYSRGGELRLRHSPDCRRVPSEQNRAETISFVQAGGQDRCQQAADYGYHHASTPYVSQVRREDLDALRAIVVRGFALRVPSWTAVGIRVTSLAALERCAVERGARSIEL